MSTTNAMTMWNEEACKATAGKRYGVSYGSKILFICTSYDECVSFIRTLPPERQAYCEIERNI